MFCPKCGKDCADANFCMNCGAQLKQYTKENVSETSKSSTETSAKVNVKKGSTEIPTSGGYLGTGSSLVLSDSAISVCVKSLFKKHRTWIPYNQLVTVVYSRPVYKGGTYGALLFRGEVNKGIPIPYDKRLTADNAAVRFYPEKDTLFYHMFYMLKAVAPDTTKFEMIVPSTNIKALDELLQKVDMDYFYNMYAPHRERAASGIHAKHEIPIDTARALVDRVFDDRQRLRYETDPLDAIRDLNLVVDDMRRRQQRENRADAERRKRQEQGEIKTYVQSLHTMKMIEMLDDDRD